MPRAAPHPKTRFVKLAAACEQLGICRKTFWRRWHRVFTDPRPKADRRPGCERKVYEDELAIAIEESSAGPPAILRYRRTMRRT